jgi:hypothetical protein
MLHLSIAKNKTEELMNRVTGYLLRSKKKYFVICENSRGIRYVDHYGDVEFLKRVREKIDQVIEGKEKE